jgi:hypothetical protein
LFITIIITIRKKKTRRKKEEEEDIFTELYMIKKETAYKDLYIISILSYGI